MTVPAGDLDGYLRPATPDDIPYLENHHRMMFGEIEEKSGNSMDPGVLLTIGNQYATKLALEIPTGACVAWVIQIEGRVVSSGAISIVSFVPVPHDPSSRIALLHSIYTEKEYRHRHFACRITRAAAEYCKSRGIRRLYLFAGDAGRSVYEKAGFEPVPNLMILRQ